MSEVKGRRKDGTEFPLELSISALSIKGKWHAIGIMRDITDRRSLEAQLLQAQKMETVGLLAGGIAHDFNNILNVIVGYGSLAEMKLPADDPLRSYLIQILAAAENGANLTHSLLNFSRKETLNTQPVDINEILRLVDSLLLRILREDIRLETSYADEVLTVAADSGQLQQLLINLATNAKLAMPKGGALTIASSQVTIDAEFIARHGFGQPGEFVRVSITDTGVGMTPETAQRIFEPFFTTRGVGEGTGLGLSIVYGIVRQHQGYIDVSSAPGQGTTFRVYLPLIPGGQELEKPEALTSPPGGTETILLAEDNAAVREMTEETLTGFGYRVITATDGREAVRRFQEQREAIQLLLFDVIMPFMSGKAAADQIRRDAPEMPVLFMSGYTADFLAATQMEPGTELLMKPFLPLALAKKVRGFWIKRGRFPGRINEQRPSLASSQKDTDHGDRSAAKGKTEHPPPPGRNAVASRRTGAAVTADRE